MSQIPPELAAELETLQKKHADQPEGRFFVPLANAHRKAGEIDHAISLLEDGLELHPDYLSAHIVLGRCHFDRGDHVSARAQFQRVIERDPHNLVALQFLGEIARHQGQMDEALHWYRELIAADPMNEDARRVLVALESGDSGHSADEAPPVEVDAPEPAEAPAQPDAHAPVEGFAGTSLEDDFNGALNDLESVLDAEADLDDDSWFGGVDSVDLSREEAETEDSAPLELGDEEIELGAAGEADAGAGEDVMAIGDAGTREEDEEDFDFDGLESDDLELGPDSELSAQGDRPGEAGAGAPNEVGDERMTLGETDEPAAATEEPEPETELALDELEEIEEMEFVPGALEAASEVSADDEMPAGPEGGPLAESSAAEVPDEDPAPYEEMELEASPQSGRDRSGAGRGGPDRAVEPDGETAAAEPAENAFGDDLVVTETMARLYMEQGLHEQAVEVYRKLMESRGDDVALRERLQEAERAAARANIEREDEAMESDEQAHPFDASFAQGFGVPEDEPEPAAAEEGVLGAEHVTDVVGRVTAEDAEPVEGLEPIGSEAFTSAAMQPEEKHGPAGSIGAYLDQLLGWPGRAEDLPDEAASGAVTADEEPWVAPPDPESERAAPAEEESEDEEAFSYEAFFSEEEALAEDEPEPAAAEGAPVEPEGETAGETAHDDTEEDDDDLESFQSWLQSLKR